MGVRIKSVSETRLKIAGLILLLAGTGSLIATDRVVEGIFRRWRPELEKKLTTSFGHPLKIGPYRGLRPWGLAVGPSEFLPGPKDESRASFSSLKISVAPIASLINLRPVALVAFNKASFSLTPNSKGDYWVFGESEQKEELPFDLRLRLNDPARIFFEPANLEIKAAARALIHFSKRRATGKIHLHLPDRGVLRLNGGFNWDRLEFSGRARLKAISLKRIQGLFSKQIPWQSSGKLGGDLRLNLKQGYLSCRGGVQLTGLKLKGIPVKQSLVSEKTFINCRDNHLKLPHTEWINTPWKVSLAGEAVSSKSKDINLSFLGFLGREESLTPELLIKAELPLIPKDDSLFGELFAELNLRPFPLAHLRPVVGVPIAGTLTASGQIQGLLSSLRQSFSVKILNPRIGGVRLQEDWQGFFETLPSGGGELRMASVGAPVSGKLVANLDSKWLPTEVTIQRGGGSLAIKGSRSIYNWQASNFRLDGVEIALPISKRFESVFGELDGEGGFALETSGLDGNLTIRNPRLMGLHLKKASLSGSYLNDTYKVNGEFLIPGSGMVSLVSKGSLERGLKARFKLRKVSAKWLAMSAIQLPQINAGASSATGNAEDLGNLFIKTFGGTLDGQLRALSRTKFALSRNKSIRSDRKFFNTDDLPGTIDGTVELKGPDLQSLELALDAKGDLLAEQDNNEDSSDLNPFTVKLNGPIWGGQGDFSILNLPFSLLKLLAPLPSSLKGGIGVSGKYRLSQKSPNISAELSLIDASMADSELKLDKGKFTVSESLLRLDIALRSASSLEPLTIKGQLPLNDSSQIDLRLESHDDGLAFLAGFANGALDWKGGDADMRLLITGTLKDPQANGFLVMKRGEFFVMDQEVKAVNSSMLFDFNRLEIQRLQANIGSRGSLKAEGAIAIIRPSVEKNPLKLEMSKVRVNLPGSQVEVGSNLTVMGALLQPRFSGQLNIDNGTISPAQRAFAGSIDSSRQGFANGDDSPSLVSNSFSGDTLPEQKWDFEKPLLLLGQDVEAPTSKMLRGSIPDFPSVSFDNLRMKLGPNLRITSQPLANFRTDGVLTLNGALDPSLQATGVVRLLNGRVNLFTTSFKLDRSAPNVAVFTPSLGLVPYLDVAMTSRVSETVGNESDASSSNVFATNGTGAKGIGGQFRLVKVMVDVTGPADQISENIELRSSPPMPRSQLLGLIGGNSLAGLSGGGDSNAITTVLGRSLLSPVLGTITDFFSDRLQLALYPTYVTPETSDSPNADVNDNQDQVPGKTAPQQAWVTEVGVDLSERINFSLLAAPNRNDVSPQGSLTYQMTPNFGVGGSLDTKGTWQGQLQLFFRF